ncbi:MAG: glycosyltransferase family 39 protein [Cytophagaceae bacterium]|nr:glycosyltransferase family 39 protein [Cytophagaceae bacterium]
MSSKQAVRSVSSAEIRNSGGISLKMEYLLLAAILFFVTYVRMRLLAFPLERDEGEYAYMGSLILDGIAPYKEAYNMKFPGTYFMYVLNMVLFGETTKGIHLGLLWVNLASIIFLFLLAKKLLNGYYAVIAAGIFALTSLSTTVLGFAAHATHFVMLFALAGLWLTWIAFEKNKLTWYLLAGFVLGLAPLMKQSGIFFCFSGGILIMLLWIEKYRYASVKKIFLNLFTYLLGGIVPFILLAIYLLAAGAWEKFIFWTFTYASDYANQIPLSDAYEVLKMSTSSMIKLSLVLWIMSAVGLLAGFFVKAFRLKAIFVLCFCLLSFASVCPGFYFRSHYFIQYLPALGISFAVLLCVCEYYFLKFFKAAHLIKWVFFGVVIISVIKAEYRYLFKDRVNLLCQKIYGGNPFLESIEISRFIKENSGVNDKIAILGSEPQILFYSQRRSATGYIYTYSLMEKHPNALKMQKEMIAEIEKNKPTIILMVNVRFSWLTRPDSEKYIFEWYSKYMPANGYIVVAVADKAGGEYNFVSGEQLKTYRPQSDQYIVVSKRVDN